MTGPHSHSLVTDSNTVHTPSADGRLQQFLEYRFEDPGLLEQALTHRSVGPNNNERLEFLGDAILSFIVARELYSHHPGAHEGALTRLRAGLVKRETLATLAREVDVGAALRLGSGELKSGGRDRDSILADALEGIIGAIYLDGGLEAVDSCLRALYADRLHEARGAEGIKDPKTRLQEALQSRGLPLPHYRVVDITGAAHAQHFTVECQVGADDASAIGAGSSRRKAEQDAADKALEIVLGAR